MDHQNAQAWLDRYVAAWLSYDRDDVAPLFSEDVALPLPPVRRADRRPRRGRRVVARRRRLRRRVHAATPRARTTRSYAPVAVDGDTVVATGTSTYRDVPDGPVTRTFENCFVMRFDADGRCREFTEYYLRRP